MVAAGAAAGLLYVLRDDGVAMLRRYRYLFLTAAVLLLLLPLLPSSWPIRGAEVNGSRLWVRIAAPGRTVSFQPGEFAKVLLTVFLASYLAERHVAMATVRRKILRLSIPEPRQLGPVILAAAASFVVLVYQRDLGAALLLFILFVGMIYLATGRAAYLVSGAVLGTVGGVVAYRLFDHLPATDHVMAPPIRRLRRRRLPNHPGTFRPGKRQSHRCGSGERPGRTSFLRRRQTSSSWR